MFFITYKKAFLLIAMIIILLSTAIIFKFGLHFGIDFTGGSMTEVSYNAVPQKTELENILNTKGLGVYSLRESVDDAGKGGYILTTRDLTEQERTTITTALTSVGQGGVVSQFTSVGPVIGQELATKAIWAIVAVSLVIMVYVAFAFSNVSFPVGSWVYGGIVILVLMHDVLVPTAMMAILGHYFGAESDVLFVTALLAVLGYSVNDTIVIFDRVRENLKKFRTEKKVKITSVGGVQREEVQYTLTRPFGEIVGQSITETILRSINSSSTTLLALFALYFVGGSVTQNFALVLIVGVIAGTYSSICIANPLLVYIAQWKDKNAPAK